MAIFRGIADRIKNVLKRDKDNAAKQIATGISGSRVPLSGHDLLSAYGYDIVGDYLRLENDLVNKYIDYESMDEMGEVSRALDIMADDATQPNTTKNRAVWATSDNKDLVTLLDNLFYKTLRIDDDLWGKTRTLCKYGSAYDELLVTQDGLISARSLPPPLMRRVEGPRGELYGFLEDFRPRSGTTMVTQEYFNELLKKRLAGEDQDLRQANIVIPFEDWEVVHYRLQGKHPNALYGSSVLDAARWIWKRLMILEDSALIYRLQRSPEKLAFYVNTGDRPAEEALAYVNQVRQMYRKKTFINPTTGKLELKMDVISPMSDYFIPVDNQGRESTRIETVNSPSWQCLTGDTTIPLLDGTAPTIKELASKGGEFWTYSIDSTGKMVPGRGHSARVTHEAAEIWEVGLDNGEVVRCTGNHPFMTRQGEWVLAENLVPETSLMPLYRRNSAKSKGDHLSGYEQVYDPKSDKYIYTHHRVFESLGNNLHETWAAGNVIHHKDHRKLNNNPTNLGAISRKEHAQEHITWAVFASTHIEGWVAKGRAAGPNNHKVVFVRKTEARETVYDLTVDEHHNFAIGQGVIVHNSVDDLDYFLNKFFTALGVPKAYLSQDADINRAALSQVDVQFARSVLRIQREVRNGLNKMARVHLAAIGIDPYEFDYELHLTTPSSIFELAQIEVLNAQADLATRMQEHVTLRWLLTKVYKLSEDEVEEIIEGRKAEKKEEYGSEAEAQVTAQEINPLMAPDGGLPGDQGGGGAAMPTRQLPAQIPYQGGAEMEGKGKRSLSKRDLYEKNSYQEAKLDQKFAKLLKNDRFTAARLSDLGSMLQELRSHSRNA